MADSPGRGDAAPASVAAADLIAPPLPRRMASWVYEGVLLFGVLVPAGLVFSILTQMRHALQHRELFVAYLFVVLGVYCVYFWSKSRRSP